MTCCLISALIGDDYQSIALAETTAANPAMELARKHVSNAAIPGSILASIGADEFYDRKVRRPAI